MEQKIFEILVEMQKDMKELKQGMKDMQVQLDRIEQHGNDDVVAMLRKMDKDHKALNKDVEYLAGRVGNHDMQLDRITKQ